jgi:hypothetical protein
MRFVASDFFNESSSSKPPENNNRIISNFFKNLPIFVSQGTPPVSMTQVVNFPSGTAGVVGTGGKFS